MEKEWKIRQALYHKLNSDYTDDLKKVKIEINKNIVENAVRYFFNEDIPFIYPSKSYVVAICYAYWLSKDFGEDFYELLDDNNLLYGNDPYFKTYSEDTKTYDEILKKVMPLDENKGIVPDIKNYYMAEFFI
jgi:hypothetical protein